MSDIVKIIEEKEKLKFYLNQFLNNDIKWSDDIKEEYSFIKDIERGGE